MSTENYTPNPQPEQLAFNQNAARIHDEEDIPINSEPRPTTDMSLEPKEKNSDNDTDSDSSSDQSDAASGYERESNECTEFCIECCSCFGLFAGCCPADSDSCVTTVATFCGNILMSCCKC
ncbi:uncharacterized protein RJT20DRAFT_129465 [Scheffersomyces xylosifermentans]|uniref:uncharacterized protein n=1 Tax=Scheffersomyces xylosifermentans TaxID=1304137 RepID=UPI00315C76FB